MAVFRPLLRSKTIAWIPVSVTMATTEGDIVMAKKERDYLGNILAEIKSRFRGLYCVRNVVIRCSFE